MLKRLATGCSDEALQEFSMRHSLRSKREQGLRFPCCERHIYLNRLPTRKQCRCQSPQQFCSLLLASAKMDIGLELQSQLVD